MSESALRIFPAVIQSVERREAGRTSAGDRAVVRLEPGIVALLETRIAGTGIALGAGYQARWNVPFGIAATAAYALIAPMQSAGFSWTGFDVEIEWRAAAELEDALLAEAEVTAIDQGVACFAILSRTSRGRELFTGRLRLRAVCNGKPMATSLLSGSAPPTKAEPPPLPGHSLLAWVDAPERLELGRRAAVRAAVANDTAQAVQAAVVIELPPGAGLTLDGSYDPVAVMLPPHSRQTVRWTIRADRPHEVNLGKPWPVQVSARADGVEEKYTFQVSVPDPRRGRIFYVLNEDCETFDGGPLTGNYGANSVLGNANNFMDPEDYRVQMIEKPQRMNAIAERYGARWTHFWCVPQRFAVNWAAAQSPTGAWPRVAAAMDESVRRGSVLHEYAPHIHFDYEPDSRLPPQPRLVYDAATDGILPNQYYDPVTNPRHHFHDWDGAARGISYIKELGDLTELDSKTGSLRKYVEYLARMQANRRYPLIARTGSFDFGAAAKDQEISTAAYEANGLRANSDARFTESSRPRGRQAYWCSASDRMREVESLAAARLVQMAVPYETDFLDAAAVNLWFAAEVKEARGCGVHLMAAMTHAMFMRGEPDAFRSLEGGSFSGLDQHLAWVRSEYPEVEFATASEALVEFLDYYTPRLEAYVDPVLCGGNPAAGIYEYAVRLLGAGIRVDERHPAELRVTAPPLFRAEEVECLRVLTAGAMLAQESGFDAARRPSLAVTLTGRPEDLRLRVEVKPAAAAALAALHDSSGFRYAQPPEPPRRPLFEVAAPRQGDFAADVLRLLMNPVAGAGEPLGRRIHPLGVFVMGSALTAAIESAGAGYRPRKLRLRWRKALALDADLKAATSPLGGNRFQVDMRDHLGDLIAETDVELEAAPQDGPPSQAAAPPPVDWEQRYATLLAGVRQYDASFRNALAVYRPQRAWKVMLWTRSAYAILFRRGWGSFLKWLPHSLTAAPEDDMVFPELSDFVDGEKTKRQPTE